MSKILDHNINTLKVELDNGSVLFLSKEGLEVYGENNIVYLKGDNTINTFPFENIKIPLKNTIHETVLDVRSCLDSYENSLIEFTTEESPTPLTISEVYLSQIRDAVEELIVEQNTTNKYLRKIYNPE